MDLNYCNKRLEEIVKELKTLLPILKDAEYKYNKVYYDCIVRSGLGNAEKREAEAFLVCDTEGVLKPFTEAKIDVRTLINEKECLTEISKNIRTMRGQE